MSENYFLVEKSDMKGHVFCQSCSEPIHVGDDIVSFEVDMGVVDECSQSATGHLHKNCFMKEIRKLVER